MSDTTQWGKLKLEVDVVVVVVFIYIFYQTVNTALRIARFLLVSCQITSFFFFSHKTTLFLLTTEKNTIAVEFVICVQGYKAEGLLSNYKY